MLVCDFLKFYVIEPIGNALALRVCQVKQLRHVFLNEDLIGFADENLDLKRNLKVCEGLQNYVHYVVILQFRVYIFIEDIIKADDALPAFTFILPFMQPRNWDLVYQFQGDIYYDKSSD